MHEILFLAALGSALLCGPMLLAPLDHLRRGEARLYEILEPTAWLGALSVLIIACWPPSDWAHLEWNLLWGSYYGLLGLAFPMAAGVACFCLVGRTSDEVKPDKLSSKWKAFRVVGLVGAVWGAFCLLGAWNTEAQCSACEGEGVIHYQVNIPLPEGTEESNGSRFCIPCGGSGQDEVDTARRNLYPWKKALVAGDAQAQFEFGLYLKSSFSSGFPYKENWRDEFESYSDAQKSALSSWHWLKLAAEQGHVDAHYYLGKLTFQKNRDEPFHLEYLEKAAEQDHVMAQHLLARMYLRGLNGVERDLEEGKRWCKLACESEQQYANAYQLGARVYSGEWGGPEDATRATELYRRAALLGDSVSMRHLSSRYARGDGVEQDRAWAFAWAAMASMFRPWTESLNPNTQHLVVDGLGVPDLAGLLDVDGMTDAELEAAREHTNELWEVFRQVETRFDIEGDILPVHPL